MSGSGTEPSEAGWEKVATGSDGTGYQEDITLRRPVPGGWLYRVIARRGDQMTTAMCFVPKL